MKILLNGYLCLTITAAAGSTALAQDQMRAQASATSAASRAAGSPNWGLQNTQASQAWKITEGKKNITVAIIDTGADAKHPDLASSIWINEGEVGVDSLGRNKSANGLDDDGNGYIDDFQGWNFSSNTNDIRDNHGHGTHIAGIIGASGPRLKGVAPGISLMILKYYDAKSPGENNLRASIRAIDYAIRMKAQIINYSGGGLDQSPEEKAAIQRAEKAGILFVAAAGNEKSNSDLRRYYPANYGISNIISVAAIDPAQKVLASSNYGANTVDIAAPGQSIYSTLPDGLYGCMTGTSQATAFVTGVAALLMSEYDDLRDPKTLIQYLVKTGDFDSQLASKTKYQVRLNSYRALAMKDKTLSAFGKVASNLAGNLAGNLGGNLAGSETNFSASSILGKSANLEPKSSAPLF